MTKSNSGRTTLGGSPQLGGGAAIGARSLAGEFVERQTECVVKVRLGHLH